MDLLRVGGDRAILQRDLVYADVVDVAESHHVLDPLEQFHLCCAQRGAVKHGRCHGGVEAHELTGRFETCKQIVEALGFGGRLGREREAVHQPAHVPERLEVRAVEHPRVTRSDPPDPGWPSRSRRHRPCATSTAR